MQRVLFFKKYVQLLFSLQAVSTTLSISNVSFKLLMGKTDPDSHLILSFFFSAFVYPA